MAIKEDEELVYGSDYVNSLRYLLGHAHKTGRTNEELFEIYRKNPTAKVRNEIFENNLGLLKIIVCQYANRTGETTADLVTFASMGLMSAIEGYDSNRGFAFSTYAGTAIFNTIKTRMIRKNSGSYKLNESAVSFDDSVVSCSRASGDDEALTYGDLYLVDNCSPEVEVVGRESVCSIKKLLSDEVDNFSEKATTQKKVLKCVLSACGKKPSFLTISRRLGISRQGAGVGYLAGVRMLRYRLRDNPQTMQLLLECLSAKEQLEVCSK